MAESYVKHAGVWKKIPKPHVRTGTTWKEVKNAWVKVNGVWKLIYEGALVVTNDSTVANYNLFTQAGSPSGAVNVVFVNNGIIYGTSTGTAALRMTGFGAGSTIFFDNNNFIYAKGGNGGNGGRGNDGAGSTGQAGGTAIEISRPVSIDNSGWIYGGSGGGGGGGAAEILPWQCSGLSSRQIAYGGGGGGGRSYSTTSGGTGHAAGGSGLTTGAGVGGAGTSHSRTGATWGGITCNGPAITVTVNSGKGGNGGGYGGFGATGVSGSGTGGTSTHYWDYAGYAGGAGGRAITRNGQAITWVAGSARVSGAIV